DVGRALLDGREDEAVAALDFWLGLFGDRYYLELQRTGRAGEETYLNAAVQLASARGVPVVATNDVRFIRSEDFEAHEARVCIHDGTLLDDPKRPRRYSPEQYLKSPQQLADLFRVLPEAIENAVEVARRCSGELMLGMSVPPACLMPASVTTEEFVRIEAKQEHERRLAKLTARDDGQLTRMIPRDASEERLETE